MASTAILRRAAITAAGIGNNTIVAAVTDRRIRVMSLLLIPDGTASQTIQFESGAGGTALTGIMDTGTTQNPIVLPYSEEGWMETLVGALLNMDLGVAGDVTGMLTYKVI